MNKITSFLTALVITAFTVIGTANAGYVHNDPINNVDQDGRETVFIGGAGDQGEYKTDFVRALSQAGLSNVRGSNNFTMGGTLPGGFLVDAAFGVPYNNQDLGRRFIYNEGLSRQTTDAQFNLVGYSWGAVAAAQQAISMANQGQTVDNLVLIGAPINQSLVDRLSNTSGILNINYINLTDQGDPIAPGIKDRSIIGHGIVTLPGQMSNNTGHFYYSLGGEEGATRRDDLAKQLREQGLE